MHVELETHMADVSVIHLISGHIMQSADALQFGQISLAPSQRGARPDRTMRSRLSLSVSIICLECSRATHRPS